MTDPKADDINAAAPKPAAKAVTKGASGAKSKPAPENDLKTLPLEEVEKKLASSPEGLTQAEAQKRLAQYGPNEIEEKKTNLLLKFLSYFWGPIPWMIEAAVILSAAARHWPDFGIILLLLLANAVVGFWEERQAGNAIDALKATLAVKARVKRDGKWIDPPARELVPGDAIRLRLGDIVPADARLLEGDPIEVDQSALTGESLPATRKSGDAIFSGSIIRQGEIGALVYATGANTYFGKTAELVQDANTTSHFQRAVLKIGNYLIILAVVLVAVIIAVAIYRGDPILTTLQFALVLTVAAIPVAMPTVLSVTMAVGARLLAKKQAIVSRLVAIEELAGVDVLCADKTGTLTQNKLTLGDPFSVNNVTPEQVILNAALASRADNNDTIDLAVLGGLKDDLALKSYQILHFVPFDAVHKRTEATVKSTDGKQFKVTKGAPQVILALASNAAQVKDAVDKAVGDFAARGFRALGVARAEGDGPWMFVGVLPLFDPPREDAATTIATAGAMGVKIKMVTGDALAIAVETAKKLGIGANILDAGSLGDAKHEESEEVAQSIEKADGFAQVFPEHKFHIIDVLQKRDHIVGMTGDGVNDAPALKKADCGIAVSGATDAARAAAAIVLMTPGLSVIIDAIKESRRIFQRMNSYAIYRIAETLRVLLFMTLSILIFNFYPLTAVMIVMLALLNDGAILSIAYDNVHYKDQPEAWNMRVVLGVSTVLGIFGVVSAFGLFYLGERVFHLDRAHIQTLMYLKLSVAGHLTIFLTRTRGPFWSIRPARILWIAVLGTQILATLIAVYGAFMTPLGWDWAAFVWGYALVWFLINDRVKLLTYWALDRAKVTDKPPSDATPQPETKAAVKSDAKAVPAPVANNAPQEGEKDMPTMQAVIKHDAAAKPEPRAEAKPEATTSPDPRIKGVALTGSVAAGRVVAARAGQNLKKSSMELGGSDAFIVLDDADLEKTIPWAVWGRMYNGGQTCCAAKRFIVLDSIADKFLEKFTAALSALKPGDPMDEKTTHGPLSTEDALLQLIKQVDGAVKKGAKILMGGKRLDRPGSFMQITILTDIKPDNPAYRDEFFGPVVSFYRVKDEAAAIALANDSDFGLGGSVFTKDIARGKRVASQVDTGMMFINNLDWADAELPFGGIKYSGYGRELGNMGIQEFVNKKLVRIVDQAAPT